MTEDILYEKGLIKITYLHSPESGKENSIISTMDHELWIKERGEEERFIIQRGILRELAYISKEDPTNLTRILTRINPDIPESIRMKGINLKELEDAFKGAYQKESEEFEKFVAEHPGHYL